MKYSLRSLMIVVTLVAVILGGVMGRIESMRRRAAFHQREQQRYFRMAEEEPSSRVPVLTMTNYHAKQAAKYRRAVYRPWMIVDDTSPEGWTQEGTAAP